MRDASESHRAGGVTAWNETGADVRMTRAQIAESQRLSREWIAFGNGAIDSDAGKRRPYVGLDLRGLLLHGGAHYERGCLCLGP